MSIMFQVASYIIRNGPSRHVILDGRTFSHRYQVAALEQLAEVLNVPLKIIECVCSDETARQRLEAKGKMGWAVDVEGLAGLPGVGAGVFKMGQAGEEIGEGDFGF